MFAHGIEARLIDLFAHHRDEPLFLARAGRETAFPMPERAVAVGDGQQADVRDIVEERDRRIQQAIAEALFEIGERQQLLAQFTAVRQLETPDAADLVGGLAAFDCAPDREADLIATIGGGVFQGGFDALKRAFGG